MDVGVDSTKARRSRRRDGSNTWALGRRSRTATTVACRFGGTGVDFGDG